MDQFVNGSSQNGQCYHSDQKNNNILFGRSKLNGNDYGEKYHESPKDEVGVLGTIKYAEEQNATKGNQLKHVDPKSLFNLFHDFVSPFKKAFLLLHSPLQY